MYQRLRVAYPDSVGLVSCLVRGAARGAWPWGFAGRVRPHSFGVRRDSYVPRMEDLPVI